MISQSAPSRVSRHLWLPEIALLLAYVGTRVYHLADLPPHIDEVFHVYRARDVWALHPLYFINTTKLLNVWLIALFYPFANPYWAARIVSVLASLVTLICVYKLGDLLHSRAAGLLAGYLYLVLPLTFWHDRIAISDPVASAAGSLVVLSSVMLIRRANWRYAALAGASLTVALLSKVTMLLVWPVPALAWILLGTKKHLAWRKAIRLVGAYGVGLVLASPVIVYSYLYSDLGARQVENRTQIDTSIPALLAQNARQLFESTRIYVGLLVLLWLGAALVVGIIWKKRKGTLFLLGAAALPIAALMAVGTRNDTRYYLLGLPPLLALMGIGGTLILLRLRDVLSDRMSQSIQSTLSGVLLVGLAVAYWPFFSRAYEDASSLTLPPQDYATYVSSHSSGFGWDAATERLREMAAEDNREIVFVAPVEGHAWRAQIALTGVSRVEVFQPVPLTADWLAEHMTGDAEVYLVREEPRPEIDWAALGVSAELVETFPKPGGTNWVELYRLTPLESET